MNLFLVFFLVVEEHSWGLPRLSIPLFIYHYGIVTKLSILLKKLVCSNGAINLYMGHSTSITPRGHHCWFSAMYFSYLHDFPRSLQSHFIVLRYVFLGRPIIRSSLDSGFHLDIVMELSHFLYVWSIHCHFRLHLLLSRSDNVSDDINFYPAVDRLPSYRYSFQRYKLFVVLSIKADRNRVMTL